MKTLKTIIAILALTIFTFSCSKDDVVTSIPAVLAPWQDPLSEYLVISGFGERKENVFDSSINRGLSFIPLVNGKITAIVTKLPGVRSGLRATIWDKASGIALRTELIDVNTINDTTIKQIIPLDVLKDKEYYITLNTNIFYYRTKRDGTNATYPFIIGDIKITSYAISSSNAQVMPNIIQTDFYGGDCSFKFQK